MSKVLKPIPYFRSEAEEREFWQTHDSTEYVDWSKAKRGVRFPNLKLTSKPITIRLPDGMIDRHSLNRGFLLNGAALPTIFFNRYTYKNDKKNYRN